MTDDTLSSSVSGPVSGQVKKARDRNHAVDDADRMWAPESAEDIDPVLLQPTSDAPDPPADPTPHDSDFESGRQGRYADVHRQTADTAKGKVSTEPGTYGQGDVTPATQHDAARPDTGKEIKP